MNTRDGLGLALIAAASALSTAVADNLYWAGGPTGYWDDPNTWTNASEVAVVPGSADVVTIQAIGGETITITNTATISSLAFAIADGTEGTLVIEPGANLSAPKGAQLSQGVNSAGTIIQNGGTFSLNANISFGRSTGNRVGRYYMNGGTLTFTRNGLFLGYSGGSGYFYQSGGTVTVPTLMVPHKATVVGATAHYEISGGALTVSSALNIGNDPGPTKGTGIVDCEFKLIGSVSSVELAGTMAMYAPDKVQTKLTALIDNGGVSPIRVTGAASTVSLAGEFAAGVAHGVAFTATNAFDVISGAPTMTGSFSTLPDASLWTTETVENGGLSTFRMALAEDGCKGTLRGGCYFMENLTFAPVAAAGHVKVNVQGVGKPMPVRLTVNPGTKTVEDLIDYLKTAGFDAGASDRAGYDVMFTVTPSAAESYLVWDLSAFDSEATVSAVCVGNPQPALRIMID